MIEGQGIRFSVRDHGKGIASLKEIYKGEIASNYQGLGLGLSGVMRMMDEFVINTSKEGTIIVCTKWN